MCASCYSTRVEMSSHFAKLLSLSPTETSVDNNADRQALSDEHMKRTSALSQHLKHIEKEKSLQVILRVICSSYLGFCLHLSVHFFWGGGGGGEWRGVGGVRMIHVFVFLDACAC